MLPNLPMDKAPFIFDPQSVKSLDSQLTTRLSDYTSFVLHYQRQHKVVCFPTVYFYTSSLQFTDSGLFNFIYLCSGMNI